MESSRYFWEVYKDNMGKLSNRTFVVPYNNKSEKKNNTNI